MKSDQDMFYTKRIEPDKIYSDVDDKIFICDYLVTDILVSSSLIYSRKTFFGNNFLKPLQQGSANGILTAGSIKIVGDNISPPIHNGTGRENISYVKTQLGGSLSHSHLDITSVIAPALPHVPLPPSL